MNLGTVRITPQPLGTIPQTILQLFLQQKF